MEKPCLERARPALAAGRRCQRSLGSCVTTKRCHELQARASCIAAAGRSQFLPVAANDSAPNKALNRRTEIILTPKLDQLFQLLGNAGSGATPAGVGK